MVVIMAGYGLSFKDNMTVGKASDTELYARTLIPALPQANIIVIMLINNNVTVRASCHLLVTNQSSVSYCPVSTNNFDNTLVHEAVGHGLGGLGDEYVEFDERYPQNYIDYYFVKYPMYFQNLDITNEKNEIRWKHWLDNPSYPQIGIFEGASRYAYGVWRSEEFSIMLSSKYPYLGALSREILYKRIKELVGETYSFEDFLEYDKINEHLNTIVETRSAGIADMEESMEYMRKYHAPPVFVFEDN